MSGLRIERIGPGASVQDLGRVGYLGRGLSRGGAADRLALLEGAALLDQSPDLAALELTAMGGRVTFERDARFALTGAPMRARLGGGDLRWHAAHRAAAGETLTLGPATAGVWSYLSVGGGIDVPPVMGSRAAHLALSLGTVPREGETLPLGTDPGGPCERILDVADRFRGGTLRVLSSAHTALFEAGDLERFADTRFTRSARGNRQGVRLDHDGAPFSTRDQRGLVSEVVVPGDIQMTGDGTPYLLLPECQTTGGYPRIASVLPDDLPRAAQAAQGATLRFRFVERDTALAAHRTEAAQLKGLRRSVRPLVRDPREMRDLAEYQLISGVTAGRMTGEDP